MNFALILAAGTGSRMGNTDKPKQFLPIYGKPLMVHTIEAFEINDEVDAIIISTNEEYIDDVKVMCKQYDLGKVKAVVAGGSTRQISVYNGLKGVIEAGAKDDDIDYFCAITAVITLQLRKRLNNGHDGNPA